MRELGIPEKKEKINDKVFEVQLLRRGKDHPDLPAANYSKITGCRVGLILNFKHPILEWTRLVL